VKGKRKNENIYSLWNCERSILGMGHLSSLAIINLKGEIMQCLFCGNEMWINHTHDFCNIACALEPDSPDPHETPCNVENCMEYFCDDCGWNNQELERLNFGEFNVISLRKGD
jgi:hypothetical protein